MKDVDTLTYPSLEKMARIFRAGIPVELCVMRETSTLSANPRAEKKDWKSSASLGTRIGLEKEFCAQTWKTSTPWSYSTRTRAGKWKPEEHFTSSVHSDLPSALQCCLAWFSTDVFLSHPSWCASNTGNDGRIHGSDFSFSQSPSGPSSNTGQETSFLSYFQLVIMGSAVPWYICSSFLLQFHIKSATSEESSLTEQYYFTNSSLNLLFIANIHGIYFASLCGAIIRSQLSIHFVSP